MCAKLCFHAEHIKWARKCFCYSGKTGQPTVFILKKRHSPVLMQMLSPILDY